MSSTIILVWVSVQIILSNCRKLVSNVKLAVQNVILIQFVLLANPPSFCMKKTVIQTVLLELLLPMEHASNVKLDVNYVLMKLTPVTNVNKIYIPQLMALVSTINHKQTVLQVSTKAEISVWIVISCVGNVGEEVQTNVLLVEIPHILSLLKARVFPLANHTTIWIKVLEPVLNVQLNVRNVMPVDVYPVILVRC